MLFAKKTGSLWKPMEQVHNPALITRGVESFVFIRSRTPQTHMLGFIPTQVLFQHQPAHFWTGKTLSC